MADFESSLRTYLIGLTAIKAAFGSTNTRIYIDRMDESITPAYPFAIIRTVNEAMRYALDGELKDDELIQIDVYSTSKTTANSGAAAIKTALSAYKGTMGSVTAGSSFVVNTRGQYVPENRTFLRSMDVQIGLNG